MKLRVEKVPTMMKAKGQKLNPPEIWLPKQKPPKLKMQQRKKARKSLTKTKKVNPRSPSPLPTKRRRLLSDAAWTTCRICTRNGPMLLVPIPKPTATLQGPPSKKSQNQRLKPTLRKILKNWRPTTPRPPKPVPQTPQNCPTRCRRPLYPMMPNEMPQGIYSQISNRTNLTNLLGDVWLILTIKLSRIQLTVVKSAAKKVSKVQKRMTSAAKNVRARVSEIIGLKKQSMSLSAGDSITSTDFIWCTRKMCWVLKPTRVLMRKMPVKRLQKWPLSVVETRKGSLRKSPRWRLPRSWRKILRGS